VTFKFQGKYKPEKESWGCGSISPSRRLKSVPTTGPSQVTKTVPDGAVPIYRPSEVYEQSHKLAWRFLSFLSMPREQLGYVEGYKFLWNHKILNMSLLR
jgi:hypothetical protein